MDGTMSEIRIYAANFAPRNWAICAGQTLAISTNQALFSLLGTTYGGNGMTNFQLPDFRGRIPAGTGTPQGGIIALPLGGTMGANAVTAILNNLPTHNHVGGGNFNVQVYADEGNTGDPSNNYLASLADLYSGQPSNTVLKPVPISVSVGVTGNNQPISVQQPYLAVNYIICMQGIYPSRN